MQVEIQLQSLLRPGAPAEDQPGSEARADGSRGRDLLWTRLDREITDKALWVPLFSGYQADLVSKRVGNYEYNPWYGALLSQLWVR